MKILFNHLFPLEDSQKQNKFSILINVAQLILLILLIIQPVHFIFQYLSFPYLFEYREAAAISVALDFANVNNPYVLENFPSHMYVYGLLQPLLISLFVKIASHPIIIARIINVIFLLFSLLVAVLIMKRFSAKFIPIGLAVVIFLNSMCLIWKINGARPDAMGLFFSFLSIYLVLIKRDHILKILLSAFFTVICFFTKQYFIYVFLIIFPFLFFYRSKRYALVYAGSSGILLILSLLLINQQFPLYINYTILHHMNLAGNNLLRMGNETKTFISYYWILFILYFIGIIIPLNAKIPLKEIKNNIKKVVASIFSDRDFSIFHIGVIISLVLLTFLLGKHDGNTYTYYGELLLPFLVFGSLSRVQKIHNNRLFTGIIQVSIMLLCVFPFAKNYAVDFPARSATFERLYDVAQNCETIYEDTPLITLYKLDHQIAPVYNNGQSEYALSTIPEKGSFVEHITQIPPEALMTRYNESENAVDQKIRDQAFDCIFLDQETPMNGYSELIRIEDVYYWTVYVFKPANNQ